jgi:predicted TIM-barrel fold metal-dependent hydrolase
MIVDIHVHLPAATLPRDERLAAFERMLDAGRRAGIDKQVLLGQRQPGSNERARELVELYPDQVSAFVRIHGADPQGPDTLTRYVQEYGFRGVKLYPEANWELKGLLACYPVFVRAAELGVPVLLHSTHEEEGLSAAISDALGGGYSFPVRTTAELGKRYPETTFILAHAGHMWVKAFRAAKPYPNLFFDVSGFDPERGPVEMGVETLGAERILFGSDAPGRSYAAQLAKVHCADISEWDKSLVLGGNAVRLLNLEKQQCPG